MQVNSDSSKTLTDIKANSVVPPVEKSNTRISTAWFLIVSFMLGLTLLLIFILQNLHDVSLQFFSLHWKIPLGIAMLLALVAGGLLVALFGTARVVQLSRKLRTNKNKLS